MRLQYEVAVIGIEQMRRTVRSAESILRGHARQTEAITRRATGTSKPQRAGDFARGMDQIGKAARAGDIRAAREAMALERRRHTEAMRHRAAEARTMAAGFASIGKAARTDELRRHREAIRNTQREGAARARMAARTASSMGRGAAGAIAGGARNVAGLGAGILGVGGGFAVAGAVQSQMAAQAVASNLANQAGRPELKGSLLKQLQTQKGFSAEEAAGGASAFQAMAGDIEATQRVLPMLSELALASGSSLEDLGAAAGSAFTQIRRDVKDPVEQMKKLADVMRLVAAQGQEGAIEIRDLGREMPRLAGVASKFVGDKDKNLGAMAAFSQIAVERGGAANAAQAVSGVEAMARQLGVRGAALEGMGVKVFTRDKRGRRTGLRDPTETVINALKATGGDIPKLQKIFGEEGMRGIEGLRSTFVQGGGGAKGEAAVRDLFKRFSKTMTAEQVSGRAASRMEDPDLRFKEQVKSFNREVGSRLMPVVTDSLLPALEKLAPHVANAADAAAKFATWFAENPLKGIGAVIAAAAAKDVIMAGVGKGISSAVESLINAMRPKAPPVPGGVPVGGGATPGGFGGLQPNAVTSLRGIGAIGMGLSMGAEVDAMKPAIQEKIAMDDQRRKSEPWYESILRGVGKGSGSAVDVAMFGGTKGKNVEAERVAQADKAASDKAAAAQMAQLTEAMKGAVGPLQQIAAIAPVAQNRTQPIAAR